MPNPRVLAPLTAAVLACSVPALAHARQCEYGTEPALHIKLHPPPGGALKDTPFHASIRIGGGTPKVVQVDTGSPAILVPREVIGPEATVLSKGQSYGYISSGRGYLGDWVLAKVEVELDNGQGGPPRATSRVAIPVYGVTHYDCKANPADPSHPRCKPLPKGPSKMGMMGISYKPFQVPVTEPGVDASKLPGANLFLNLGSQTPGYILTADSLQVGLNQSNTRDFQTLPMVAGAKGEALPRTCISYVAENGKKGPFCGASLLMDTGINSFYLTMPAGYCPAKTSADGKAPTGATFTLSAPDLEHPVLAYSFKVGDRASSPMTPEDVKCVSEPGTSAQEPSPSSFHVNTGRMVLAGMDYLYRASDDPACQVIGFRPRNDKGGTKPRE